MMAWVKSWFDDDFADDDPLNTIFGGFNADKGPLLYEGYCGVSSYKATSLQSIMRKIEILQKLQT